MKKLLLFVLTLLPITASADDLFCINGVYYKFSTDDKTKLTVVTALKDVEEEGDMANIVIPSVLTIQGTTYRVVSIGNNAFKKHPLETIVLTDGIESIGVTAFGACSHLKSITIPNSVTKIGDGAFYGCSSLESIILPNKISKLGSNVFWGCTGLTTLTIPQNVTVIGEEALRECENLGTLTIPDGVTEIGKNAFQKCFKLKDVYCYAKNVPKTDNTAFDGTPTESATLHVPVDAVETYKKTGPWSHFKEIVPLPSTSFTDNGINFAIKDDGTLEVTGLASSATKADILSSVTIYGQKYRVTSIGKRAFEGRSDITYLSIPYSVKSIGENAFLNCGNKISVNIADPESWCQMELGNEYSSPLSCAGKLLIYDIETSQVDIPKGVTSINSFTFYRCNCIKTLNIPASVKSIGSSAFWGCTKLNTIISQIQQPFAIDENVFSTYSTATLIVPAGTKSLYQSTAGWNIFAHIVEVGAAISGQCGLNVSYIYDKSSQTLTVYGEGNMYGFNVSNTSSGFWPSPIRSVIIEPGVISIGRFNFYGNTDLTSIIIANSVTTIGKSAFVGCKKLRSVRSLNSVPPTCDNSFEPDEECVLWVPKGSLNAYKKANGWKEFHNFRELSFGDVNLDFKVNQKDLSATTNFIMGNNPGVFYESLADLNGDETVNAADVVKLVTIRNIQDVLSMDWQTSYSNLLVSSLKCTLINGGTNAIQVTKCELFCNDILVSSVNFKVTLASGNSKKCTFDDLATYGASTGFSVVWHFTCNGDDCTYISYLSE